MNTMVSRRAARWLVLSSLAYESISGFWRQEFGEDSVLAERLNHSLIEELNTEALESRCATFSRRETGPVVIIFDYVDDRAYAVMDALPEAAIQGLDIRLAAFRDDTLAIVSAMNSRLLVDEDGFDVEEVRESELFIPFMLHAASSDLEPDSHMEVRSTGPQGEELILSVSRRSDDDRVMLKLQVGDAEAIKRFLGHKVILRAGARRVDLGEVLEDGAALAVVRGPVDLASEGFGVEVI